MNDLRLPVAFPCRGSHRAVDCLAADWEEPGESLSRPEKPFRRTPEFQMRSQISRFGSRSAVRYGADVFRTPEHSVAPSAKWLCDSDKFRVPPSSGPSLWNST